MAGILASRHGIKVSKQAIHERFNGFAVSFFKSLLENILTNELAQDQHRPGMFRSFSKVRIKDSTCFQLPECLKDAYPGSGGAGSPASVRIQFEYDIKTGEVIDLSVHAFNDQDIENAQLPLSGDCENDLFIRDLGYICIESLKEIQNHSAYYLNRLQTGVSLWQKVNGEYLELGLENVFKKMEKENLDKMELEVYLGAKKTLKTRLVIFLLPEKIINERIRKAKANAKKKGRNVSKKHLSRLQLNLFITNITIENMPAHRVWEIYRLRWQIELIFKVWKSVGAINIVKKVKRERFEAFLYARLIWIMLNWKIIWIISNYYWEHEKYVFSIIKIFKHLAELAPEIRHALNYSKIALKEIISKVFEISPKYFLVEKRKDKLSIVDILTYQLNKC